MPDYFEAMYNAIRSRFKTEVADTVPVFTLYDADPTEMDESSPVDIWVRFVIQPVTQDKVQTGAGSGGTFRTRGVAIAQVFGAVTKGDGPILELVDIIEQAFRSVTDTGVVFHTPYPVPVGRQKEWWQINVNCPFHSDQII